MPLSVTEQTLLRRKTDENQGLQAPGPGHTGLTAGTPLPPGHHAAAAPGSLPTSPKLRSHSHSLK